MLEMVHGLGSDPAAERDRARVLQVFPFSSDRKRMSTVVQLSDRCGARQMLQPGWPTPQPTQ